MAIATSVNIKYTETYEKSKEEAILGSVGQVSLALLPGLLRLNASSYLGWTRLSWQLGKHPFENVLAFIQI